MSAGRIIMCAFKTLEGMEIDMILITGARGFVGAKLLECMPNTIASPTLRDVDVDDIKRILDSNDIDTIIHTAAISDIGECAANPEGSYKANVILPVNLAKAAEGRKLICFSSDQVYSGSSEVGPYTEDMVAPDNLYSRHKLEMEERVLDIDPDAVMLRAEWMYDYIAPKANYYLNMVHAKGSVEVSFEQYRGVTYLQEVADAMEATCKLPGGAYNFGSETNQSMLDITKEFFDLLGKEIVIGDIGARHNLWMDCSKARSHGVDFSDVIGGLKKCYLDEMRRL